MAFCVCFSGSSRGAGRAISCIAAAPAAVRRAALPLLPSLLAAGGLWFTQRFQDARGFQYREWHRDSSSIEGHPALSLLI
jgi:hypothetical protein